MSTNLHTDVSVVGAVAGGIKATAIGVAAFGNAIGKLGMATEKCADFCDKSMELILMRQEKAGTLERMELDAEISNLRESLKAKPKA